MIVDSVMFPAIFLATNRVSLKSLGEFMFLNKMTDEPILDC